MYSSEHKLLTGIRLPPMIPAPCFQLFPLHLFISMRIAIDVRLTHYTSGGISAYERALAAKMPALDVDNEYLLLHSRKAKEALPAPAAARRVNCWTPAHHRLERWTLSGEILTHRPRLLHMPDFIPPQSAGWRTIITVHDLTFLHYPMFLTAESRRYYNRQIESAVQRADAILSDSEATRKDILELLPVPPEKVTTVHLAQDARFAPQEETQIEALQKRLELPHEYILFVGTFEPRKNVNGLLNAYAQLRSRHPDAPALILTGNPGWLFDETLALVERLQLGDTVMFLKSFPAEDLPVLYSGASLFVLPSHYEGFGLPVLEAMACGTVCVIANRASLPEIAGEAALRFDPDNIESIVAVLERTLADSALRADLRERGFARAREFNWEKCCRQTLAVYRSVLAI